MMNILIPKRIEFAKTAKGRTTMLMDGRQVAESIFCVRLFPLTDPERYISVSYKQGKEDVEVGILRNLADLPGDQRELVLTDLDRMYFLPEILDIEQIKMAHGMDEWFVVTDRGPKEFFVNNRKDNMTVTEENMLIVTDIEKCRYRIDDHTKLSGRARHSLGLVLP